MFWGPFLLVYQNQNTAKYLKHSLKVLCFINNVHKAQASLSLQKKQFDFGFIYLTSNQTKTDYFTCTNLLLKEKELENSKLQSYWNHCNVSLIPSMTKKKHAAITTSARKQNWKKGDTKINFWSFNHSYLSKWKNSKSSEFLKIFPLPMHLVD